MFASVSRMDASSSMIRIFAITYLGLRRQLDLKTCSWGIVVVDGDAAIVVVYDAVHDRQAEAGAAAFRGKVGKEKLLLIGVRHAAAGIGDFDDDAMRCAAGRDTNFAALGRLDRILQ